MQSTTCAPTGQLNHATILDRLSAGPPGKIVAELRGDTGTEIVVEVPTASISTYSRFRAALLMAANVFFSVDWIDGARPADRSGRWAELVGDALRAGRVAQ